MDINEKVELRHNGEDDPLSLRTGKICEGRVLKQGWFGIVDETGEEYAFPPALFELADGLDS